MAYKATVIQIMIASPGDVTVERNIVREEIAKWNYINSLINNIVLLPMGWETHSSPELGERPQELINKRILKNCDILIGIFWTRLGTPTGKEKSGTVEEIKEHVDAGKPAMIYFSSHPVNPSKVNHEQYAAVQSLKDSYRPTGLIEEYENIEQFREKIGRQIQFCIDNNAYIQKLKSNIARLDDATKKKNKKLSPLSETAEKLLKAASLVEEGKIYKTKYEALPCLQIGRNIMGWDVVGGGGREYARWEHALEELVAQAFVRPEGREKQVFALTHMGWELADTLPEYRK